MRYHLLSQARVNTILEDKIVGWHLDGGGLYLHVSKEFGGGCWILRFSSPIKGVKRDLGLGSARTIKLAGARKLAEGYRLEIVQGKDPIEERKLAKIRAAAAAREIQTLESAVHEFLEIHGSQWRSDKHRRQWLQSLKDHAFKSLGRRPVAEIDAAAITSALAPIWQEKAVTASRVKQRIERVTEWVRSGKPLPLNTRKVQHLAAMPYAELPAYLVKLRKETSIAAKALEFTILCAARTGETTGARWSEIDLDAKLWRIPGDRMKAGKAHEVPLTGRAVEILKSLDQVSEFVFADPSGPIYDDAMLLLLNRTAKNGYTTHGFRSSFRDWAGDMTDFPEELIEQCLAHAPGSKTQKAYRRSTALAKRREVLQAWTEFCSKPFISRGKVVELDRISA
jgi:integrase